MFNHVSPLHVYSQEKRYSTRYAPSKLLNFTLIYIVRILKIHIMHQ